MAFKLTRIHSLSAVTGISMCFFIAEISVGFYTHSLAPVADACHCLNDSVGFIIALVAPHVAEKHNHPTSFAFGWQRAQLLGAFFNRLLLFGLVITIYMSLSHEGKLQQLDHGKI